MMVHILDVFGGAKWIFSISFVDIVRWPELVARWVRFHYRMVVLRNSSVHDARTELKFTSILLWVALVDHDIAVVVVVAGLSINWNEGIGTGASLLWQNVLPGLAIVLCYAALRGMSCR